MVTKKLMHDVITFCNNYIDNDNIIITITKYATYLHVNIAVWTLDKEKYINQYIGSISKHIHDEVEFNKLKETIKNEVFALLTKLNIE